MATKKTRSAASALSAGVYVRISQDRTGDELGVTRQRQDCEKLAKARGWTVGAVYTDDDVSAFKGRHRPGYEQLLEALKAGTIQAVIAWHPDRLHRSPVELERFITIIESTGAAVATVQAGELDLSTASGRMTARVVGAVARHESEQKSERLKRQREQAALAGKPHGGKRSYGYRDGKIVKQEAAVIKKAAARILAGVPLRRVALDLNAADVTAAGGGRWSSQTLRQVLASPRIAGLRVHRGEVVGPGSWEAIISREDHEALRAILARPGRSGAPTSSLLGGLLRCGKCGATLHHSNRKDGRVYLCAAGPNKPGCGKLSIVADPVEEIITEVVLRRLDTPKLARTVKKPKSRHVDVAGLEAELAELAKAHGAGRITMPEWMHARAGIEERLDAARRQVQAEPAVLAQYQPGVLRDRWPTLDLDDRRAVIGAVLNYVTIDPSTTAPKFDPCRIQIPKEAWRG